LQFAINERYFTKWWPSESRNTGNHRNPSPKSEVYTPLKLCTDNKATKDYDNRHKLRPEADTRCNRNATTWLVGRQHKQQLENVAINAALPLEAAA